MIKFNVIVLKSYLYCLKTIEELVLLFYASIQDYYEYKSFHKSIDQKQY